MFGLGIIGNTMNMLIFTKLTLFQGNCCAFYLIAESVTSLFFLILIYVLQTYITLHGVDLANISILYCKANTALGQASRLIIDYIVCLQTLDQYLSTHYQPHIRSMSTLKLARYLVIITAIVWILQTIPYFIFYDIIPPLGCIINNQALKNYYSFFHYLVLHGFLPILLSAFFSILAYRNVRRLVRRQIPIGRRRLDRQLTAMIFVRVLFFIILLLQYTIFRAYSLNINVTKLDSLNNAIFQLISAVSKVLAFANYCVRFLHYS
ncbi:unnamed protein product [Rotaria sp. Silwood2]|nr:unnamed protein product [Rotaria sp. Silwood2]